MKHLHAIVAAIALSAASLTLAACGVAPTNNSSEQIAPTTVPPSTAN